jgi:hypothetical protein
MISIRTRAFRWTVPLLLVSLVGCNHAVSIKIVPVTGTLKHKGKSVAHAHIEFSPEHGHASSGETDQEGRFKLRYDTLHEGALVGKHQVSIVPMPSTEKEQEAVAKGKKLPLSKEMASFFDRYSPKNSKVEVDIQKDPTDLKLDWD